MPASGNLEAESWALRPTSNCCVCMTNQEMEDHRDRGYIIARMNHPDVAGSLRSDFKAKFGHPDDLSGALMGQARVWVEKATSDIEPF